MSIDRRDFLKLVGAGAAVIVLNARYSTGAGGKAGQDDFFFVQLSDTHWGFSDKKINPDAAGTLRKTIVQVNSLAHNPDFIVFTGDLTHTTDDPKERRKRMGEFREIISELKVKNIKLLAGEHDAGLDMGEAYREYFGKTHYTFDHKGVHFIAIDNVSDPSSSIGEVQLQWLADILKPMDRQDRIVILTHRPLFDLYPQWDWWTRDGAKALQMLAPFKNAVVLYGHIHQENHHLSGNIMLHSAKGLMYPLPAPGSIPKKAPIPWDPANPYKGLGYRSVEANAAKADYVLAEFPVMEI